MLNKELFILGILRASDRLQIRRMRPANESEEEAGRLFGLDEVLLQQSNRNAPPMWNNSGNANPVPIQSQSRSTNLLDANTGALMSNLTTLQHKARVLETFIQNNYAQFEGGYQQQAAVSVMSTILYDLISTGASVLQSVQGNQVPVVTTPATETKDIVQPQQQHSEDEEEDDVCVGVEEYEVVEMNEDDILVEHTHFCEICGKGFRRDANVRMHMRAHGNEYKTPEALMSNKDKEKGKDANNQDESRQRRYSCPFDKCRRNRNHRKFKPLKSIQSLRNHYKRSHCPKMYTCNKCNKHFSVVGDLKTHGKTCGHNRWRCSCGTTFTRKDKLFGHVSLFEGHRPLLPIDDINNHNASSSVSASASRKRKTPSSAMPTPTTQLMSASTATSQSGVNAISVPDYFVDCFAAEKAVPVPVPVVASQQHKNNSIDGFHTTGFYDPEFWADFPAEFADK